MKTILAFLLTACLTIAAQAQTLPPIGSTLSAEDIERMAISQPIPAGEARYRLLDTSERTPGQPESLLVNERGQVGLSHHEVTISGLSTEETRIKVSAWAGQALEINYFEQMKMTALRFARFADAAKARDELELLLPQARVSLPVRFSQPSRR